MNNRNSLQNDIRFGLASETVVLKRLEKHFGIVFAFQFVDCLCYIVYNEKDFHNFKRKEITYYRDGIEPKPVNHIEIPIEQLIEIKMGCDGEYHS